jgi:hypothetical protein
MAFTAYILLGDTLLGGAPCVVAIGMGHELRNFRAKGVCRRRNPRLLPPPQGLDHPRKHASTPLKTSTRPCSHHPSHPQPATQPASSGGTVRNSAVVRNVHRQDCGFMSISTLSAASPQPS